MSKTEELLGDALEMAMEYIQEDILAPEQIVLQVLPFIKRAAKIMDRHGKKYTPEQQEAVVEKFLIAMRYYSQVTGMQGITYLDLTIPVAL